MDIQVEWAISTAVDFPDLLFGVIDTEGQSDEELDKTVIPQQAQPLSGPIHGLEGIPDADVPPEPNQLLSGPSRSLDDAPAAKRSKFNEDAIPQAADARMQARKQPRQHNKRRRVRNEVIAKRGYQASSQIAQKHLDRAEPVKTALNTAKLPVAGGAYTALNKPTARDPKEHPDIAKLVKEEGFQYIAVDPNEAERKPRPILDRNGYIIGHIAPPPEDDSYLHDTMHLFNVINEESNTGVFTKDELHHKRGDFPAVNFGFALPNGFKDPITLDQGQHKDKISRICSSPGFKQISCFQNALLAFWYPGMYKYQKDRIEQVLGSDPSLQRTTPKTIYPTTACNFRNVCCYKHRDTQNCPFGWCAITALGCFDHTKGGHLILWELKLIIEFPHGYAILIPSATITHSNTPVTEKDIRVSVTQYCGGGILRYADNLCNTDKALSKKENLKSLYEQNKEDKKSRWLMALGLLSTLEDLKKRKRPHISMFQ